jgi:hypothetical protein
MKVTDYKTSKRLKEIGFEAETNCYWCNVFKEIQPGQTSVGYPAYDLETIMEALPKSIDVWGEDGLLELSNKKFVGYVNHYSKGGLHHCDTFGFSIVEGETLATTAAKLLIKLIEDKIINIPVTG